MIRIHPISADVRVVVDPKLSVTPPADVSAHIDDIWQAELARQSRPPFNGPLFSIASPEPHLIIGWHTEYKCYLAQRRKPALFDALKIKPLAVTGLLLCLGGVVFGKRSGDVEQDKSLWELVPAGGVDGSKLQPNGAIDLGGHLLSELAEETGIRSNHIVTPLRPFALVEDSASHVFDVGIILRTTLTPQQITETFHGLENREYTALDVIETSRLKSFADSEGSRLAAVSAALLKAISYCPANA